MLEAGVPAFVSVDVVDSVVIFSLRGCYTGCTSVSAFVAGGCEMKSGKPRVLEQGATISKFLGDWLRTVCRPCYGYNVTHSNSLFLPPQILNVFLVKSSTSLSRRVRGVECSEDSRTSFPLKFYLMLSLSLHSFCEKFNASK